MRSVKIKLDMCLTVKAMRPMVSSRGVSSTPHEVSSASLFRHVQLRAWGQESSGETPQWVRPWCGRSVDGAAIDPGCHKVDLHVLQKMFWCFGVVTAKYISSNLQSALSYWSSCCFCKYQSEKKSHQACYRCDYHKSTLDNNSTTNSKANSLKLLIHLLWFIYDTWSPGCY